MNTTLGQPGHKRRRLHKIQATPISFAKHITLALSSNRLQRLQRALARDLEIGKLSHNRLVAT